VGVRSQLSDSDNEISPDGGSRQNILSRFLAQFFRSSYLNEITYWGSFLNRQIADLGPELKKIPADVQTGEEAAEGGRLFVIAEEPNALFLLSAGSGETEVETGTALLPQSSAVSRKQVRLPSLSLPLSIPAAAEDEDDQNRKKVLSKLND